MPVALTVREICEEALRKIGAFAIRDSEADGREMDVAATWLDMLVGHVSTMERTWWLVGGDVTFPLTPGVAEYDVEDLVGQGAPTGIAYPIQAHLAIDGHPHQTRLRMVNGVTYGAIDDKASSGDPCLIWFDRRDRMRARVWPVPTRTDQSIVVQAQRFASRLSDPRPFDFTFEAQRQWSLYLVVGLAAELGDGPVRKLPADEVRSMRLQAERLLDELQAYANRETTSDPQRVAAIDF